MSRPLSSYPEHLRGSVAARRIREATGGLGHLSALDYQERIAEQDKAKKKAK